MDNKVNKLLKLAESLMSKEEAQKFFAVLVDFIKKAKQDLDDKNDQTSKELNAFVDKLTKQLEDISKDTILGTQTKIDKALKEQEIGMNFIRDKIRKIKNGIDGMNGTDGKDGKDGKDGSPDTGIDIVDKVVTLPVEERWHIEDIYKLREELDELRQLRSKSLGGGGFNTTAFQQKFVDDETPTNSGDNLNFTINLTPSPASSLKVYRNGQRLKITEDYTFSGKTITLLTSLGATEILTVDYKIM